MKTLAPTPHQSRQPANQGNEATTSVHQCALMDHRPETDAIRARHQAMSQSPRQLQMKALAKQINSSPRMVAQRLRHAILTQSDKPGHAGFKNATGSHSPLVQPSRNKIPAETTSPVRQAKNTASGFPLRYTMQFKKTDEKWINTKNYGSGYYQYNYDSKDNIDDFSDNIATSTPKGKDPVDSSSLVNLDEGTGTGQGEMLSGNTVDIVGASRSRHFSIADRLNDGTPADRKGTYTWHHLTPEYYMVLVDMEVHNKFWHKGGVSFWS